ncbi:MAG TPA: hypothetical protein EYP65_08735, partial [Armatimonadetes bacterium]|nr:hypothetical protein [Armatimonadota bacterium]
MRWRPEAVAAGLVGLAIVVGPFVGGLPQAWRGALLGGLLLLAFTISPKLRISRETALPLALGATFVLSALWSARWAESLTLGLAYLGLLLLPAGVWREDLPFVLLFMLSALVVALLGVREFILMGSPTWRVFGPFVNPNMLA